MKKRLLLTIMSLSMLLSLTACGSKEEEVVAEPAFEAAVEREITAEDVNEAFYKVLEEERNNKYSDSQYWDSGIKIGNTPEYIKVSIPREFIDSGVGSITDGISVTAPVIVNGMEMSLKVGCEEYNYDNGMHAEAIINQRANLVNDQYAYEIVSIPSGSDGSYKFIYDKEGTESYTSNMRVACKAKNCENGVVYMELSTDMMSGNLDNVLSIENAFEVLDAINIEACTNEAMAEQINEVNNSSTDDEFITFSNTHIMEAVQDASRVNSGSITKEKANEIEKLYIDMSFDWNSENKYADTLEIINLEDLRYFENVESLYLGISLWVEDDKDIPVIDFSSLENMINLQRIEVRLFYYCENNQLETRGKVVVQDLEWMRNMKNLEDIALYTQSYIGMSAMWGNDLSVFSEMSELTYLSIYECVEIEDSQLYQTMLPTDLSALANLHNLYKLNIHTAATDISPLSNLENLNEIELWSNVTYEETKNMLNADEKDEFYYEYLPELIENRLN